MATNNPRLAIEVSVEGIAKAQKDFTTLQKELINTEKEFKKANATTNELEGELTSLVARLKSGSISQKAYNKESKEIGIALASARQAAQSYQARISSLTATIDQGGNAGRQYGNSIKQLTGVHDSVSKGIRGSTTIGVEFGRMLGDLPYGIQGVANNLQQLTTNYGYYIKNVKDALAEQGKSTSGMNVFKTAIGGLLSPMSLVTIGISALTAGWVLYDKWQQKSKKSIDETKKSLTEYIDTLKGVSRAQADGQVSALKELTTVDQLYKATQNLSIPMKERIQYANELIKKGGDLFESTNAESIVAGKASEAYDKLTNSIKQTAMAQAYMQKMTDNATIALNNNLNILNEANEIIKLNQQIQRTQANLNTTAAGAVVGGSSAAEYKTIARLEEQRSERIKNITNLNKQNSEVLKEQDLLQKGINNSIENGGNLIEGGGNSVNKKLKKTKDTTKDIATLTNGIIRDSLNYYDSKLLDINNKYDEIYSKISDPKILGLAKQNEEAEKLRVSVERLVDSLSKIKPVSTGITLTGQMTIPGVGGLTAKNPFTKTTAKLTDEFTAQFKSTLRRGIADSLDGLFSNLSEWGNKTYEIEQKYNDLRRDASQEQINSLNEMERLEKRINSGITNTLSKLGSTLANLGGNLLSSAISSGISSGNFKDLGNMFSGKNKAQGYGALAGLVGSTLSGIIKPSNVTGQTLSGALSGAGTGAALGSIIPGIGTAIGAVGGALVGALSSLFGSSARKKQEELAQKQVDLQQKMLAIQERQALLSYQATVSGVMTRNGVVSSVERDAYGDLVANIKGSDIELVLERTKSKR